MESALTPTEMQEMVSSFLEIVAGQSTETANQFLQATSWNLEEAIQLFYLGNEGAGGVSSSSISPSVDKSHSERENPVTNENVREVLGDDEVRAPLPVKRETLYGDASFVRLQPSSAIAFRNFEEESKQPAVWESDQCAASTANGSRDNLASLYRPPFALMYQGTFDKAKVEAALMDKWLLVNLQSTEEFSSHMLNRDTWANEAVAQTIRTNFIFWQVYNDSNEGKKVCTYYHLVSIPAILIIDPVTGQKLRAWNGMVQPDRLLEDLLPYMERGPKEHHVPNPLKRRREISQDSTLHTLDKTTEEDEEVALALAVSMEGIKGPLGSPAKDVELKTEKDVEASSNGNPSYPPLPVENLKQAGNFFAGLEFVSLMEGGSRGIFFEPTRSSFCGLSATLYWRMEKHVLSALHKQFLVHQRLLITAGTKPLTKQAYRIRCSQLHGIERVWS